MTTAASAGDRVRSVRSEQGLSLSELARRAKVGKGTLSELEAGRRNPTLDTLYAVAGALGVPLAALVSDAVVSDEALVATRLHVSTHDDHTDEVYLIRVRPGGVRRSPAHAPGAREQLVVLEGEGVVETAAGATRLEPGVHHAWAADEPHAYRCTGAEDLVAVDVIVTPTSAQP